MTTLHVLLISTTLLWIFLVVQGCLILALIRQVGLVHERIKPVGALMLDQGPLTGAQVTVIETPDLRGVPVRIGGMHPAGNDTLLFFMSPTCPVCKSLLPILTRLSLAHSPLDIILLSDGEPAAHIRFYEKAKLRFRYVLSAEVGMLYKIGKLPYAVLLDGDGVLKAKGLVNTREHLESLLEARERNVASMQAFISGRDVALSRGM